jgi:hypothetical protein
VTKVVKIVRLAAFPTRGSYRQDARQKLESIPSQGELVATKAQRSLRKKLAANYFDYERCVITGEAGGTDASIEVIELLVQLVGRLLIVNYLPGYELWYARHWSAASKILV